MSGMGSSMRISFTFFCSISSSTPEGEQAVSRLEIIECQIQEVQIELLELELFFDIQFILSIKTVSFGHGFLIYLL
jgi:hypothetical protein